MHFCYDSYMVKTNNNNVQQFSLLQTQNSVYEIVSDVNSRQESADVFILTKKVGELFKL